MPLHSVRLVPADREPTITTAPAVGFVLYADWHPDTSTADLVRAVIEVADALRDLAQDAMPSAESVTAVAVSPAAGPHAAQIEQIRRAVLELAGNTPEQPAPAVSGLRIDRTERRVTLGGHELTLTRLEFDLLAHLAANPRRVFTRAELLNQVWEFEYPAGSRTVDAHVRRLRVKLGAEAYRLETVRGVGYRWAATRRERLIVDAVGPAA